MKRVAGGLLLILLPGCSDIEIPTVELGSGGARLLDGKAKDPYDAYLQAYSSLGPQHYNVRRNLEPRGQNLYAAKSAMERIVGALETMKSLVAREQQARFDPFLTRYRGWLGDLNRNVWGGSFLQNLEASEREVKSRLHPDNVEIVQAAAPAPPGPATEKPEGPPRRDPAPSPPAAAPKGPETPAAPPKPPGVSIRLLYNAWDRAHDELVEAYKAKKDPMTRYNDVTEALRHLKSACTGKETLIQYWIDWYARISSETKGFTTLPEKTTEQDVLEELNVAARVLRKELNPNK